MPKARMVRRPCAKCGKLVEVPSFMVIVRCREHKEGISQRGVRVGR